jgi:hypothetical protein
VAFPLCFAGKWWLKIGAMFALLLGVGIGAAVELFMLVRPQDELESCLLSSDRTPVAGEIGRS